MKKALFKLAAIFLSVCLMLSAGITFSAEDTATPTDFEVFIPDAYKVVDTLYDADGTNLRAVSNTANWKNWYNDPTTGTQYPTIKDEYGLSRGTTDCAYIDVEVLEQTEYFAVGMMIATRYEDTCDNFYYITSAADPTAADARWTPIEPVGYAEPQYSRLLDTTTEAEDDYIAYPHNNYYGTVDVIGNLPEGTTYLRIVTDNPVSGSAWSPVLDFVDVYDIDILNETRYNNALTGYTSAPVTVIEGYNDVDYSSIKITDSNMTQKSGGVNYRTDTNYFALTDSGTGYVTFTVNSDNAVETTIIFDESSSNKSLMSSKFYYATDISDKDNIVWKEFSKEYVAKKELGTKNASGNAIADSADARYHAYAYRFFNLPDDIAAMKIEIGQMKWAPTIDYIDIYEAETDTEAPSFDDVLSANGYETVATTYFDDNATLTELFAEGNNDVAIGTRDGSLGGRKNSYGIHPLSTSIANPYVIIPVEHYQAIETGLAINSSQKANGNLIFYASSDKSVWQQIPQSNIKTSEEASNADTNALKDTALLKKYRVTNLPEDTEYVKIRISTTAWWFLAIDYIDVYDIDTYANGRFDKAFDGYTTTLENTYFDDKSQALDNITLNDVTLYDRGTNLGGRESGDDQGYGLSLLNDNSSADPYVIIPVSDSNVIETGFVINKEKISEANLVFYTAETTDKESWQEVSVNNISSTYVDNSTLTTLNTSYYLRKQRITNLPEGTKYLVVHFGISGSAWWYNLLDYIDIYDAVEDEEPVCAHDNAKEYYNPVNKWIEKYCADDDALVIKGNANGDTALDICDLVSINNAITDTTDIDLFAAETDGVDGISDGDVAWLRKELLNR